MGGFAQRDCRELKNGIATGDGCLRKFFRRLDGDAEHAAEGARRSPKRASVFYTRGSEPDIGAGAGEVRR
jgi:hypothetical protein